ncbi:hypothetical protein WN943_025768 [Citrus x changshan-huyou]
MAESTILNQSISLEQEGELRTFYFESYLIGYFILDRVLAFVVILPPNLNFFEEMNALVEEDLEQERDQHEREMKKISNYADMDTSNRGEDNCKFVGTVDFDDLFKNRGCRGNESDGAFVNYEPDEEGNSWEKNNNGYLWLKFDETYVYSKKAPVTSKTSPWNGIMLKTYPMVGIEGGKLLVIGKLQKKDDVFKVAGAFYGWGKFFHAEKIDLLNPFENIPTATAEKVKTGMLEDFACQKVHFRSPYTQVQLLYRGAALPTSIPSIQCISLIPEEGLIADYLGSGGVGPQVFAVILHNEFLGLESMDKEKVQAINLPFECKQAMKISRARSGASVESLKWVVNSPHFLLHFQDTLRLYLSSIWALLSSFEDPLPLDSAATLEGACVKELIVFHGWR